MAEAQSAIEDVQQGRRHLAARRGVVPVQAELGRLEVPVAHVVPHEAVEGLDGGGEIEGVDQHP